MALEAQQQAEFALTPVGKMVRNMEAIEKVAQYYAKTDFVPATFKGKPENCAIAIDMATRMNMNPIMVMQQMYIVNGKPSISSQLIIALINNCGQFEPLRFETNGKTGDDFGIRAWTYRKNDKDNRLEGTWITQKMVKASHWGAKWQEIPEQMYKYRAAVFWARVNAPEITMGFYAQDEVEEPSFSENIIHDAAPEPAKTPAEKAMERAMAKKAAQAEKTAEAEQSPAEAEKAPQSKPYEAAEGNIGFVTEARSTPDEPFNAKEGRSLV